MKLDPIELSPGGAAEGVRARLLAPSDRERWAAFVERCPEATFFHRIEWKDIIEQVFRHRTHYLIAERDDSVVGVLPLAQVKSWLFGHALVSLPFCVYGGAATVEPAATEALHAAACALGQRLGANHLELRDREAKEPSWPQQNLYVTFRKPILGDPESNMQAIPRKQRAMVRKGIKNGLRSEWDAGTERFFALYANNVHRHGTPALPKGYFAALRQAFGPDCRVLTVLDAHGAPVSSVLVFYFRDEVLPYYAGDEERARDLASNDFKYWELMRDACERGYRVFDYGRSKCGTGSFDFKKNWGFEPSPLHYEYTLYHGREVPQHNPMNPKYRALIATWRRLPAAVVNFIGPYIVRNLG